MLNAYQQQQIPMICLFSILYVEILNRNVVIILMISFVFNITITNIITTWRSERSFSSAERTYYWLSVLRVGEMWVLATHCTCVISDRSPLSSMCPMCPEIWFISTCGVIKPRNPNPTVGP